MSTDAAGPLEVRSNAGLGVMRAYEVDDEPTVYVARTPIEAANIYAEDCGELPGEGYPRELSDAELDATQQQRDDDERLTGGTTTIRVWLAEATCAGFLCGVIR